MSCGNIKVVLRTRLAVWREPRLCVDERPRSAVMLTLQPLRGFVMVVRQDWRYRCYDTEVSALRRSAPSIRDIPRFEAAYG